MSTCRAGRLETEFDTSVFSLLFILTSFYWTKTYLPSCLPATSSGLSACGPADNITIAQRLAMNEFEIPEQRTNLF
jgi:hypothetical protein